MRHYLLFIVVLAAVSSCIKNPDFHYELANVIEPQYSMFTDFDVPITPGNFTIVLYKGDTLAVTDIPMTIQIPKAAAARSGGDIVIIDKEYEDIPLYEPGTGISSGNYLLMFEDSPSGDYDYNDLVVYLNQVIRKTKGSKDYTITIKVKPIALGGGKQIAFGYNDMGDDKGELGEQRILSSDVRSDYFNQSGDGIINTRITEPFTTPIATTANRDEWYTYLPNKSSYDNGVVGSYQISRNNVVDNGGTQLVSAGYITYPARITNGKNTSGKDKGINYFIIVDGKTKLFVCGVDKRIDNCLPYGLALPVDDNTGGYSIERTIMNETFPGFDRWIRDNGNGDHNWYEKGERNEATYYDKHLDEGTFRW